jgi:hypothetical protein
MYFALLYQKHIEMTHIPDPGKKGGGAGQQGERKDHSSGENDDFEEKYDANIDNFDEDDDFEAGLDDPDEIDDGLPS